MCLGPVMPGQGQAEAAFFGQALAVFCSQGSLFLEAAAGRLSTLGTWKLHVMQAGLLGICRVEVVQKGLGSRRQLLKDLGSR